MGFRPFRKRFEASLGADPKGEKDWAGTGRYLNVVRCNEDSGNPSGNDTDFPVYCNLPDEQILWAFISMVNAITGCKKTESD